MLDLQPKAVLLDINGTVFAAKAASIAFNKLGLLEDLVEVLRMPRTYTQTTYIILRCII